MTDIDHVDLSKLNAEELMVYIVTRSRPSVYSVEVIRNDHNINFTALANMRHGHGEVANYSTSAPELAMALREMVRLLDSLYCPHCHRLMTEIADLENNK